MKNIILSICYGELWGQLSGDYSLMKEGLDQLCERLNDCEGIMEFEGIIWELEETGDFPMLNVVLDRLCKIGYGEKKDGHYCLFLTTDKCPDRGFFNSKGEPINLIEEVIL